LEGIPPYPRRRSTAILNGVMASTIERNHSQLEGLLEGPGLGFLCPDVEVDVSELPDGRIYRGHEAAVAYWRSLHDDVWRELTMKVEAIVEQDDVVVALMRCHGVGRSSGVPVEMRAAWIATLRDGLVASARLTLDYDGALDALGIDY
jgi:ketosteroid isomerase-like protein